MGYFIGIRLIRIIVTMFLLITVVYVTMFFAPSDPVYNIAGPGSSEEFRASIRKQYGLDQPLCAVRRYQSLQGPDTDAVVRSREIEIGGALFRPAHALEPPGERLRVLG